VKNLDPYPKLGGNILRVMRHYIGYLFVVYM
jgi:hypothetical protein